MEADGEECRRRGLATEARKAKMIAEEGSNEDRLQNTLLLREQKSRHNGLQKGWVKTQQIRKKQSLSLKCLNRRFCIGFRVTRVETVRSRQGGRNDYEDRGGLSSDSYDETPTPGSETTSKAGASHHLPKGRPAASGMYWQEQKLRTSATLGESSTSMKPTSPSVLGAGKRRKIDYEFDGGNDILGIGYLNYKA
ncbi:hypothetical protein CPB83DRAFT_841404 [Crepidotus variabilis]|uniref:Uncharacterized protein n=1 Tax=Crepidotus variabilis TaxID=179855 RepID=A0A9P6BDY2_9AGAR|nr:hypothetical protein CPB83DRAFT_841404 [Crepidotus variabilis]